LAGDDQRWREILARRGPALVLYARQFVASVQDAEDAVQEGFVRFWRSHRRARVDVGYLYSCVRSAAIDLTRSEVSRRRRNATAIDAAASAFDPAQPERAAQVEAALAQLRPEQREVVVMRIWGRLTFSQIAAALRINPNTAASRYRYALEQLELKLGSICERE
jgi:RNA polymerase sigma-70 factor (ECF subfamily)